MYGEVALIKWLCNGIQVSRIVKVTSVLFFSPFHGYNRVVGSQDLREGCVTIVLQWLLCTSISADSMDAGAKSEAT